MRVGWVLGLAACGRVAFDPTSDATGDAEPPTAGLIVYFPMDDAPGGTVSDTSGTGNDGTCSPCPIAATGEVGGAYQFDGSTMFIRVAHNTTLSSPALTFACWFNLDSYLGGGNFGAKLVGASQIGWELWYDANGRLAINNGDTTNTFQLDSMLDLPLGTWTHVAMTLDGTSRAIYLDGQLVAEGDTFGFVQDVHDVYIGAIEQGTSAVGRVDARLDEVRVYNRVLQDTEIRSLAR